MNGEPASGKEGHRRTKRIAVASAAALFLRAVLDFAYLNYVARYFGGDFPSVEIDTPRLIESYVIVIVLSTWLVSSLYRRCRPSGIALILYFAVVMLPLSSLHGLAKAPASFVYAAVGSFAILLAVTGVLPRVKVPRPNHELLYLGITAILGISAYVYGWLVLTGGLGRLSVDLFSVYEVRAEYVRELGPFLGYLVPWQAYVINMFILCYALDRRKYLLLGFCAAVQVLLFGMTGQKSFLLAPVLASGVCFAWPRKNSLFYIFSGLAVLVVSSYLLFVVSGNHLVPSLMIRRLFFVPAGNHLIYYDFFSNPENPFVMLSNSILAPFVRYPYGMPVTRVIAWAYWGRDFGPNVGYLGDAFAHFGFAGMFIFSIVLGFFLRILDSVGGRLADHFVAAAVATPAMVLTNSALLTSLATHGLILAVILLWLVTAVAGKRTRAK